MVMAKRSTKPKNAVSKKKPAKKRAVKRAPKKQNKKLLTSIRKPYLLAAAAGVVMLLVLFGIIFTQKAAAPTSTSSNITSVGTSLPDFADIHPASPEGIASYRLVRDQAPVLKKADHEWRGLTRVGSWLYFYSLRTGSDSKPSVYDLYAYNMSTNQYVLVGDFEVPVGAEVNELYQMGEQLYIFAGSYKGGEVTYRCDLDIQSACSEPELFYSDRGRVYHGGNKIYVLETQADGGTTVSTVYQLSSTGERTKTIGTYDYTMGDGQHVVTIDANGFIWVLQEKGDGTPEDGGKFIRLAALDESGLRIKQLESDQIPLNKFFTYSWVDQNFIRLTNNKTTYIYDTINNTFENIESLGTDHQDEIDREFITRRLGITAPFKLEYKEAKYNP